MVRILVAEDDVDLRNTIRDWKPAGTPFWKRGWMDARP